MQFINLINSLRKSTCLPVLEATRLVSNNIFEVEFVEFVEIFFERFFVWVERGLLFEERLRKLGFPAY